MSAKDERKYVPDHEADKVVEELLSSMDDGLLTAQMIEHLLTPLMPLLAHGRKFLRMEAGTPQEYVAAQNEVMHEAQSLREDLSPVEYKTLGLFLRLLCRSLMNELGHDYDWIDFNRQSFQRKDDENKHVAGQVRACGHLVVTGYENGRPLLRLELHDPTVEGGGMVYLDMYPVKFWATIHKEGQKIPEVYAMEDAPADEREATNALVDTVLDELTQGFARLRNYPAEMSVVAMGLPIPEGTIFVPEGGKA